MGSIHYNVAPRYTGGSPAQVPRDTALKVAGEEKVAHNRALEGLYGEEMQKQAEEFGLAGIAEERTEFGTGWIVLDLCTAKEFFRPFGISLLKVRRTPRATAKRGNISLRDRVSIYTHDAMYSGRVADIQRKNTQNHKKTAYPGDTIVVEGFKRAMYNVAREGGTFCVDIVEISEVSIDL
jgi:hypothetical protein